MLDKPRVVPPCGNPKCSCSTGIHDGLTFGSGELSTGGYWQFPCYVCARAWDAERMETMKRELSNGTPKEHLDWCEIEAWPFSEADHAR